MERDGRVGPGGEVQELEKVHMVLCLFRPEPWCEQG